ncbi:MAG: signal peptide peptidase SppA [Phycisphaerales bacterium]|nr:signal peptide peptidase SppA [Phycisphaerales bacterium]
MMLARTAWWLMLAGLCVPAVVWAQDDGRSDVPDAEKEDGDEKDDGQDDGKKDEKAESPIQRLAEMRIDEFVVPARMLNLPLPGKTKTVGELLERMETWRKDETVGGVLLDLGSPAISLADIQELRGALGRLRESDKKVTAFLNGGGPGAYLLACAADEITVAPTGGVDIPGLGAMFLFLQGHYQMMGIEFDVITAGDYKYPGFINAREPNKFFDEEYNQILDGMFESYVGMIAEGRNIAVDEVKAAIDIGVFDANQALQRGLIDKIAYYDEYRDQLLRREKMKRLGEEGLNLTNVNSIQDLVEVINKQLREAAEARKAVGPKIAVLNARGPIVDVNMGAGFASQLICRDDFAKVVNELRKNKSVKAVVMRIDSPGGSGYASDVIWQALRLLGQEKPLVVSMGRVAGSGGYYIACPAARIFAQSTTITGSIGVLGIFASYRSQFNRVDYEVSTMQRGARALLGAPYRAMAKEDRQFLQDYINDFYDIFIDRVASTRRMPAEQVRKVAGGRIYTGAQAVELGLVDEVGGLNDAIEAARAMADIPESAELQIVEYPRPGSLGEIFESIGMMNTPAVLAAFQQGITAAPVVSFDQQLQWFASRPQALCWMAMPDVAIPGPTPMIGFPNMGGAIPGLNGISPAMNPWAMPSGLIPRP